MFDKSKTMSDEQVTPFWKKLPNLVFGRFNGRSGGSKQQDDMRDAHNLNERKSISAITDEYDTNKVEDPVFKALVSLAQVYRERSEALAGAYPSVQGRDALAPIVGQIEECVNGLYQLALGSITPAPALPTEVQSSDPVEAVTPTTAVTPVDEEKANPETIRLPSMDFSVEAPTRQQLEDTLSALGTVYSLMLLLDGKDVEESRVQRMRNLLSDQLVFLDSVTSHSATTTAPPASLIA